MIPPTSIDGTDITGATIDGTDVQEITVDGDVVFSAVSADVTLPSNTVLRYAANTQNYNNNDTVTTFVDSVGNFDATASGNPQFLTNQVNGLPAVSYDGSNDYHDTGHVNSSSGQATYYFVLDFVGSTTNKVFYGAEISGGSNAAWIGTFPGVYRTRFGNISSSQSSGSTLSGFHLITVEIDNGSFNLITNSSTNQLSYSFNQAGSLGFNDFIGGLNVSGSLKVPQELNIAEIIYAESLRNTQTEQDLIAKYNL